MARLFDDASSQYLLLNSAPITAMPLSMSCWFYSDDVTADQCLIDLSTSSASTVEYRLAIRGGVAGDPLRLSYWDGSTQDDVDTTNGYSANTWHHAAGVFTSTTSRAVWLDNTKTASSVSKNSPGTPTRLYIAKFTWSNQFFMSGRIAEVALWNASLSDSEVAALSRRIKPTEIKPDNLVVYAPLIRSDDKDIVSRFSWTPTGSPTVAPHAPMIWRVPAFVVPAAAAPGRTTKNTDSHPLGIHTAMSWRLNVP